MDLNLNVSKKGLTTTEEVINEEYTLRYGHIFRGEKGDKGADGKDGERGADGKSAYQQAVEAGYKGSEEDFKELLLSYPNKADKEGYYPNMSVGIADDVKNGNTKYLAATPSGDPMHYQYLRAYPINVNTPRGLQYNEATDRWSYMEEYGGLSDLTTEEVGVIFAEGGSGGNLPDDGKGRWYNSKSRTNFANQSIGYGWGYLEVNYTYAFLQSSIEIAVLSGYAYGGGLTVGTAIGLFMECRKLRKVIGILDISRSNTYGMFKSCESLEDVRIVNQKTSISFEDSPLLSKESLLYMIRNCASNVTFTITLHPDVYAKCQESGEWYSEVNTALSTAQSGKTTTITLASA